MITGPEICTYGPSLSVVDEISRNKVVVPESAAGLNLINQVISISCVRWAFKHKTFMQCSINAVEQD